MEPGLDWERWLARLPCANTARCSARAASTITFPSWRNFCEYGGGGMTDWGAHHFDIAQWGLGMDKSGPVEIVPPEKPSLGRGVKYIYENGVELIHGGATMASPFSAPKERFSWIGAS